MRSIVLLSAGLDSVVNLALAVRKTKVHCCLTFDYGQKAAKKEIYFSQKLASHYQTNHLVIKLPFYQRMENLSLIKGQIPAVKEDQLEDLKEAQELAWKVWIPNRNLVFVAIAAAMAEYFNVDLLLCGFNREESQTFPDNSSDFINAVNHTLNFSTKNKVKLSSYTLDMTKKEIVEQGISLEIPWEYIWSCYDGLKLMCGKCESCRRLIRASKETFAWEVLKRRFKNA